MISIEAIVAMSENRVIGNAGHLPWNRIPSDLEHFRRMTMDQTVIMGRKTCESLPSPLGGRYLIGVSVTTKRIPFVQEVAPSFELALVAAIRHATVSPPVEQDARVMIAGGESLYRWALDQGILSAINLTLVEGEYQGHARMPPFESDFQEYIEDDENDAYAAYRKVEVGLTFRRFIRKKVLQRYLFTRRQKRREISRPGAEQPDV